jgi:deoxyribonuclease-4
MPRLGAHMSISGGVSRAIDRAEATGCEALQIFTKSSNQWRARLLGDTEIKAFHQRAAETGISPIVSHASYLINLAAPDPVLRERSIAALAEELQRADMLGLAGLVLHPGAHTTGTETEGLEWISNGIAEAQARQSGATLLLLEHTAGQGTMLGHRFEQLQEMIARLDDSSRVGVCLDTCHLVAAGYDIVSADGYRQVFEEFERLIGFDRLKVFHLNDSKKPLGSRVDRHESIGRGCLGTTPFLRLLQDERFASLPMLLETPKTGPLRTSDISADPMDLKNLALLRALRDGG